MTRQEPTNLGQTYITAQRPGGGAYVFAYGVWQLVVGLVLMVVYGLGLILAAAWAMVREIGAATVAFRQWRRGRKGTP